MFFLLVFFRSNLFISFFKKSAVWDEEKDDELRQLAEEGENFNNRNPETQQDIVEFIQEQFTDDTKTSAQIRRRCLKLGIIQKTNSYKSPAVVWTEEMVEKLKIVFTEFKDQR